MPEPTKPRRRFALSLRALMVLVLIIGGVLGWKVRRATFQRKAVTAIRATGGRVMYDYQWGRTPEGEPILLAGAGPWAPYWFRRPIGEEYFQEVLTVSLRSRANDKVKADSKTFEAVALLDRVETIDTHGCSLDDGDFARLMAMPRLKAASLFSINVTDAGLESLETSPAIESLQLLTRQGAITNKGLAAIGRQPRLKSIELLTANVTDPAALAPLANLTRLETLLIPRSPQDDSGLVHLRGLTSLKEINLSQTQLSDVGVESLARMDRLHDLWMDGSKLTDAGLARLAIHPGWTRISLNPAPNLTDASLTSLGRHFALTYLFLKGSNVTDAGIDHFGGMKLEGLALSGRGLTDAGLAKLAENHQFYDLELPATGITDAGLSVLTGQSRLRSLVLDRSTVGDAGAATLAAIPTLTSLSLDETPLSDAGLAALQRSTSLRSLSIRGTKVTPNGLATFEKARPRVFVNSGPVDPGP